MATCPSCGADVADNASECLACGARIEGPTESFLPVSSDEQASLADVADIEGPVLVVRKGPEVGERFYLDRPVLSMGRDPGADIFLNDVTVSRVHASLHIGGGEVSIEDEGSLNGTYVNGVCVDKAVLADGDVVQVGTFQMVFLNRTGR